jgi:hypothetical protein
MKHADLPAAPVIMGIVLGPMLETHFRRALIISNGSYSTFFLHPMSAIFLCAAIVSVLYPLIKWGIKRRSSCGVTEDRRQGRGLRTGLTASRSVRFAHSRFEVFASRQRSCRSSSPPSAGGPRVDAEGGTPHVTPLA